MTRIAEELDSRLKTLAPFQARYLEMLVREAMSRVESTTKTANSEDWPPGYFERTAGALVGEDFDRPTQGELPKRDEQ